MKKITSKICLLMAVGIFFFSAASTTQNSPELHFRLINSFIQPSRVGSLTATEHDPKIKHTFETFSNLDDPLCTRPSFFLSSPRSLQIVIVSAKVFHIAAATPLKLYQNKRRGRKQLVLPKSALLC